MHVQPPLPPPVLNTNALVAAPPPADSVDAAPDLNAQPRCRRCASLDHATKECPNIVQDEYISENAEPEAADLHSGVQGLGSVPYRPRRTPRMTCAKNAASMDSSSSSGSAAARKRSMWCMVVYVDVRWCMVVYGGLWWFMLMCSGIR